MPEDLQQISTDPLENIEEKEKEILRKKRRFKLILLILAAFAGFALALSLAAVTLKALNSKSKPDFKLTPQEETVKETTTSITPSTDWQELVSSDLKLSFSYPPMAKIVEESSLGTEKNKVGVVYEKSVTDGYTFKVTKLELANKTLDEVAKVKRDNYIATCPQTSEIRTIFKTLIDTVDARTFEIKNCDGDFTEIFIPRFGVYYEITQITKGDLGYRQQYQITTNEILATFKFFPEEIVKEPTKDYKSYNNTTYKIYFEYPVEFEDLSKYKVVLSSTIEQNAEMLLSIGMPQYSRRTLTHHPITFFVYPNKQKQDTETFLNNLKQNLVDEYKIVFGRQPQTSEEKITIGKQDGVLLKGYSEAEDIMVVKTPSTERFLIVVISTYREKDSEFNGKVSNILESLVFY